jgi:hypothetical protein
MIETCFTITTQNPTAHAYITTYNLATVTPPYIIRADNIQANQKFGNSGTPQLTTTTLRVNRTNIKRTSNEKGWLGW